MKKEGECEEGKEASKPQRSAKHESLVSAKSNAKISEVHNERLIRPLPAAIETKPEYARFSKQYLTPYS